MTYRKNRSNAAKAAFDPPKRAVRVEFGIGHNSGPPLPGLGALIPWRKALKKAWRRCPVETVRRRISLAQETGLTYHEYTLELLERGRWLTPDKDSARIGQIIEQR